MKDFLVGLVCFPATILGTLIAWQDEIEWGLKIVSLLVAIAASAAAFVYYRTKTKRLALSRTRELD